MRVVRRRTYWILGLVLAAATAVGSRPRVLAQTVPFEPIDCGPVRVFPGDLVALHVGNATKSTQVVVLQAQLLDADGAALLDRSLTLSAGQSRSVSLRIGQNGLVRGEVTPLSGPDGLRLKAAVQVTPTQQGLRLTYGPHFECAGPTGTRGPV